MHIIKEDGKNGTIEVTPKGLRRVIKKLIGKNEQFFPWTAISHTHLTRKMVGANVLTVYVGPHTYEWKCSSAEALAEEINQNIS